MSRTEAQRICDLIETVENRCMAADGPVTPTSQEISGEEIVRLRRWGHLGRYTKLDEEGLRDLYRSATRRLAEP
jgi:hypothetical protein